jgi:RNA-binding protein YlmH
MSNEEIVKEIDEATRLMAEARVKTNEALCHARNVVMNSKGNEEAYNKGLEDAWELARKIYEMKSKEFDKVFRDVHYVDVFYHFTPQEALAKLEAYEKGQNEIKVGDVVEQNEQKFVIIFVNNEFVNGIDENGRFSHISIENCEKTGKHIDLTDIFKQIGSDANELS